MLQALIGECSAALEGTVQSHISTQTKLRSIKNVTFLRQHFASRFCAAWRDVVLLSMGDLWKNNTCFTAWGFFKFGYELYA